MYIDMLYVLSYEKIYLISMIIYDIDDRKVYAEIIVECFNFSIIVVIAALICHTLHEKYMFKI